MEQRVWTGRMIGVGMGYGAVAGVLAAVMYLVMQHLQHLIWHSFGDEPGWIFTFVVVLLAGLAIAALNTKIGEMDLQQELRAASDPRNYHRPKALLVAAGATIAVACGGAIGPEAGLVAVVWQLSALVSVRITETRDQAVELAKLGNAAALGALYGSPYAGATFEDDKINTHKIVPFVASVAGFGGFVLVMKLAHSGHPRLDFAGTGNFSLMLLPLSLLAAVLGAALGLGAFFLHKATDAVNKAAARPVVTQIGFSVLLALMLATFPQLKFSGQTTLGELVANPSAVAAGSLLLLALGKLLAMSVTLAAGWKGGEFFPLMLIGGAAGMALAGVAGATPDAYVAGAVAGISAALTVAVRKPITVLLVLVVIANGLMLVPVVLGVFVGHLVQKRLPEAAPAQH